jgi:hypothetical protein
MMKYVLCERQPNRHAWIRGLSCDDEGVFIAGDVPLISRHTTASRGIFYKPRPAHELQTLLAAAYGAERDFSAPIAGLQLVARYMNEDKWVLAKIASVHLRLREVGDDLALAKLLATEARYVAKSCSSCAEKRGHKHRAVAKRDVSEEPRVPAGESDSGEWTSNGGYERQLANPLVIPAQAIAPPMPIPAPLEIPLPPTEVAPFPFALPGAGLQPPPLVNPYPNKRKCVEEWAEAQEFCARMESEGKLVPGPRGKRTRGYSGFGKDYSSCVLGRVSEECGGNPTA